MVTFFLIAGLIVGVALLVIGQLWRKLSAPDPYLAAIHRDDAEKLSLEGDEATAERARMYADEAMTGEQIGPRFVPPFLMGIGIALAVVSALLLFR